MHWLRRNSEVLDAIGSFLTVFIAVAAIVAVKWQIDATDQTERQQSARDIYREHLALAIQYPTIALVDYCDLPDEPSRLAYSAYAEHFFYTAEQLIELGDHWKHTISESLGEQESYLCSRNKWDDYPEDILTLIRAVQEERCSAIVACAVAE